MNTQEVITFFSDKPEYTRIILKNAPAWLMMIRNERSLNQQYAEMWDKLGDVVEQKILTFMCDEVMPVEVRLQEMAPDNQKMFWANSIRQSLAQQWGIYKAEMDRKAELAAQTEQLARLESDKKIRQTKPPVKKPAPTRKPARKPTRR